MKAIRVTAFATGESTGDYHIYITVAQTVLIFQRTCALQFSTNSDSNGKAFELTLPSETKESREH